MESSSKAGLCWRKSRYSGGDTGQCVELACVGDSVGIRDSKSVENGHLTVARTALAALAGRIKAGDLDL
ncbi:DUF397 domain-containing protein [Actinomadura graeca]|uniref:DUF397 domain-containing protein n=1 Tax=Actinomadura graeca TaxID=2750812 RepID=A0ABX8QX40_9ACTN|nr:DUF397 domain-containing protein [Actinomadura graeca]QXJ23297.1 DUF397 domain-containing protein [Actinomadura graeca]